MDSRQKMGETVLFGELEAQYLDTDAIDHVGKALFDAFEVSARKGERWREWWGNLERKASKDLPKLRSTAVTRKFRACVDERKTMTQCNCCGFLGHWARKRR